MQKKNKKEIKKIKRRRLVNGKDKPEQDQKEKMKSHITDFNKPPISGNANQI